MGLSWLPWRCRGHDPAQTRQEEIQPQSRCIARHLSAALQTTSATTQSLQGLQAHVSHQSVLGSLHPGDQGLGWLYPAACRTQTRAKSPMVVSLSSALCPEPARVLCAQSPQKTSPHLHAWCQVAAHSLSTHKAPTQPQSSSGTLGFCSKPLPAERRQGI